MPRASFDAAVARLLTPFIVLRVFWIMLGLWAEAMPAASTQTRIVVVIAIAGFIFIPSFLFLHRRCGLAVRPRIQIMTEIRRGQARGHNTLARRVLVAALRLRIARLARRGHRQARNVDNPLHFSQPVEKTQNRK